MEVIYWDLDWLYRCQITSGTLYWWSLLIFKQFPEFSPNPFSAVLADYLSLANSYVYTACLLLCGDFRLIFFFSSLLNSPAHWPVKFHQTSTVYLASLLFVSKLMCIPFHGFACISRYTVLASWGYLEVLAAVYGRACVKACILCALCQGVWWEDSGADLGAGRDHAGGW